METAKLLRRIGFCRYHFEQIHPWDFRNWMIAHVSSRFLSAKNKTRVVLCSWQKHVETAGWRCLHKSGTHDPEQDRRWRGGPCSDPEMAWNLRNEDLQSRTTTDQHESQWNHEKKNKNIKAPLFHHLYFWFEWFLSFLLSWTNTHHFRSNRSTHHGRGALRGWWLSRLNWIWFFVFGSCWILLDLHIISIYYNFNP